MNEKSHPDNGKTLEPGYWVAVTVQPGIAPLRSYVGQIQATDDHGIRLSLMDWFVGDAVSNDLFLPWTSIQAAKVATGAHDLKSFLHADRGAAAKWQNAMNASNLSEAVDDV